MKMERRFAPWITRGFPINFITICNGQVARREGADRWKHNVRIPIFVACDPSQSNATFAKVFNEGRDMDAWLSPYEPGATLLGDPPPGVTDRPSSNQ